MLKVRIIPTLLIKNVGLVKGVKFDSWRRVDTILPAIKVYNMREVDELIVMDIMASQENREPDYETIAEFAEECFVPLTVGGGISSLAHIRNVLLAGADKVCINSAAYENLSLIRDASDRFGAQCIVCGIDFKKLSDGTYSCFSHAGKKDQGIDPIKWARELLQAGAGELIATSIDLDGTMLGYDLKIISEISNEVSIPVIASGGAGNYQHMLEAIKNAGASAVAAASIYHFTQQTPLEAKRFLESHGIPVRKYRIVK